MVRQALENHKRVQQQGREAVDGEDDEDEADQHQDEGDERQEA